jgi:hypothetical protein
VRGAGDVDQFHRRDRAALRRAASLLLTRISHVRPERSRYSTAGDDLCREYLGQLSVAVALRCRHSLP